MDHEKCRRAHLYLIPCHRNDGSRRCRDARDLYRDCRFVILQHGIDLCRSKDIPARGIDPDRHISLFCLQLLAEHGRCDLIAPEGFRIDRPFEAEHPASAIVVNPVPKLLHCLLPLFLFSGFSSGCSCVSGSCFCPGGCPPAGCVTCFPASWSFTYPPFR